MRSVNGTIFPSRLSAKSKRTLFHRCSSQGPGARPTYEMRQPSIVQMAGKVPHLDARVPEAGCDHYC
jgi:hypothetical protein